MKLSRNSLHLLEEIQQKFFPSLSIDEIVEFLAESYLGHIPNDIASS